MTTIFKIIADAPEEHQNLYSIAKNGKKKISKGKIMKVDYCMPGLMRDANGARVALPEPDLSHLSEELVSRFTSC